MKLSNLLFSFCFVAVGSIMLFSCSKSKDSAPVPRSETYQVVAYNNSGFSGTAVFKEFLNSNNQIVPDSVECLVTLQGEDLNQNVNLAIAIREGTALEDGSEKYSLGELVGGSNHKGESTERIKLSFDNLTKLNGGLTVKNASGKLVAQSEIGINKTFKAFEMRSNGGTRNGEFRVYQREEGSYLVIKLDDIEDLPSAYQGVDHPANLYKSEGGTTVRDLELSPVSDDKGISATDLPDKGYEDLIKYDGLVRVLASEAALDVTLSEGKFQ